MRCARPAMGLDPRQFGRRQGFVLDPALPANWVLGDDARLFLTTFAAGFLFVSVLIA